MSRAGDAEGPPVVLTGCTGCRSRRAVSGPDVHASGSSPPASCSEGERAPEAGPRRQSRGHGGGLTTIPCPRAARQEGAGEQALVEGRRPGSDEAVPFDEGVVETGLAAPPGRPGRKAGSRSRRSCDRGRQRLRHGLGTRTRTPLPGGATRRGLRSRSRQDRAARRSRPHPVRGQHPEREDAGRHRRRRSWRFAVKRSSTRGSIGGLWPTVDRQSRETAPARERPSAERSGIGQSSMGARFVGWLQKSERRIFPVAVAQPGATWEARGAVG